ncbi:hypothetical protein TKK_0004367 [Trichogramma kaykai]|uniref:Major facilitator superfamily (MFS) profile domain-containing protein n=1 Tax=Trichogramma kaykai TaxID=54128 RepID=A0ABD2XM82_9HYME
MTRKTDENLIEKSMSTTAAKSNREVSVACLENATDDNDENAAIKDGKKVFLRQSLTCLSLCSNILACALCFGLSTIMDKQMTPLSLAESSNDTGSDSWKIDRGELFDQPEIVVESLELRSWIISSLVFFMCPGGWIMVACTSCLGRRPLILISDCVFVAAWLCVTFAETPYQLLVGRCALGLCMGVLLGLCTVYQGEISAPELRAMHNVVQSVFFSIGMAICHTLDLWIHWRTNSALATFFALFSLAANCYLPESPVWLVQRDRPLDAEQSWMFLRGELRFAEFQSMLDARRLAKSDSGSGSAAFESKCRRYRELVASRNFWKPLSIILLLFTVAQTSGVGSVTFYCMQMVSEIAGEDKAYVGTLALDALRLFSSLALTYLSGRHSTRRLTLASSFASAGFLCALAGAILSGVSGPWLPLVLLFCYEVAISIGLLPLAWTYCSELFSPATKELSIGIVTSYNYLVLSIVVKTSPYFFAWLGPAGTFLFYGLTTLVGACSLYCILPNTSNKSLIEIETMFTKRT